MHKLLICKCIRHMHCESDTCTLLSTMKDKGYFCIFGHTCKPSSTHLHQQRWTQRTHYGNDQAFANIHTLPGTLVSSVLFLHMFTLQRHLGRKADEVYYNDDDDFDDASLSIIHHVKRWMWGGGTTAGKFERVVDVSSEHWQVLRKPATVQIESTENQILFLVCVCVYQSKAPWIKYYFLGGEVCLCVCAWGCTLEIMNAFTH